MIGKTIAHYHITKKLGQGGMGEVYRAEDTSLKREVAIKVLPEEFARDPQRLARFEREAQLLASLNHPNIGAIYGLEKAEGKQFLILELVEGETLSQRIGRGAVPVEEALKIALQIAEGLEAAHNKGVIHRDLKPANVKVTPDGKVKILDFGLARVMEPEVPTGEISNSPTLTNQLTTAGVILGTAAYMSPEQARAKPVDKRTDIWAFGAVLFEMLTGKKAFEGETVTEIIAALLRGEPDWEAISPGAGSLVRSILRRCLRKDPTQRIHDIADVRIEIEESLSEPIAAGAFLPASPAQVPRWKRAIPWGIAAAALMTAAITLWNWPSPEPAPLGRLAIIPVETAQLEDSNGTELAISADGKRIVYAATREGVKQLYVRPFDDTRAVPIRGTEGTSNNFFLSPDGEWVAFSTDNMLKKVSLSGGSPITLCDTFDVDLRGGSWDATGTIVFSGWPDLYRVSAAGGEAERLASVDLGGADYTYPQILPDGDAILCGIRKGGEKYLAILSLEPKGEKIVLEGAYQAIYASTGHLVYTTPAGTLMGVPFALEKLEVTGEAVPLFEGVRTNMGGSGDFGISGDGTLIYVPSGETGANYTNLWWVDRSGQEELVFDNPLFFGRYPRLSPDGRLVALTVGGAWKGDIWIYDLTGRPPYPLTQGGGSDRAIWTPDGRRLAFGYTQTGATNIHWTSADGSTLTPERLLSSSSDQLPRCWSPDGKELIFLQTGPDGNDLMAARIDDEEPPRLLVKTQLAYGAAGGASAALSPGGRWLAYDSRRSGKPEVWVQAYPEAARQYRISLNGGRQPEWAPSGDELYYLEGNKLMAVAVETGSEFRYEVAKMLFEGDYDHGIGPSYDVAPDGRFLMVRSTEAQESSGHINVVLNWFEELQRLVPTE